MTTTESIGMYTATIADSHLYMLAFAEVLCYDDGCHLRKYARNPVRSKLSKAAVRLSNIDIVIDKMHFAGHTDAWCKANCNPYNVKQLEKVTQIYSVLLHTCMNTYACRWIQKYVNRRLHGCHVMDE